jgi:hypothetical protein
MNVSFQVVAAVFSVVVIFSFINTILAQYPLAALLAIEMLTGWVFFVFSQISILSIFRLFDRFFVLDWIVCFCLFFKRVFPLFGSLLDRWSCDNFVHRELLQISKNKRRLREEYSKQYFPIRLFLFQTL